MKESICWNCKKACNTDKCYCSWSEKFIPVEGWEAEETSFKNKGSNEIIKSYCVISCPKFASDDRLVNKLYYYEKADLLEDMANFFSVSIRTIQRRMTKFFAEFEKEFGTVCLCF